MAVVMTDERRAASLALMRQLSELRTRRGRARYAPLSGRPTVLALEHDLWSDVVDRIHAYSPPVMLAVYYPATNSVRIFGITSEPVAEAGDSRAIDVVQTPVRTVGQVVGPRQPRFSVPVTRWETVGVTELLGA